MISIGLDQKKSENISEKLNVLLANYQMYYQNLRGFHWNVTGSEFFELHEKFEEYYGEAQEAIDEIAERILTLGQTPLHTFKDYESVAEVEAAKQITDGKECVSIVARDISVLLKIEREILDIAGDADDEGTSALMSDYIRAQEKMAWMLNAYLK
ncbi:DNA starvation/stationary phase protection protein (plasmid) [Fulvitalea axinellae]|uniref:DNA starvation/stationary phase protection protein n=1 Tax=Fulvitalea axinellae TaxID=1182444 RepID=A0AAU9D3P2_9BACT|nr:DNA starvation/stationary phase protection protein [Fulvitalea axinellae]